MGLTADAMAAMRTRHRTIGAIAVAILGFMVPQAGLAVDSGVPAASPRIAVTGDPAPIETIRTALLAAAPEILPKAGDARVTLRQTIPSLLPLPPATGTMLRRYFRWRPAAPYPHPRGPGGDQPPSGSVAGRATPPRDQ